MITTEELKTILFKRRFGVFKTAPKEPSPLQRDNWNFAKTQCQSAFS